jgi:hypothetical protein
MRAVPFTMASVGDGDGGSKITCGRLWRWALRRPQARSPLGLTTAVKIVRLARTRRVPGSARSHDELTRWVDPGRPTSQR